MCIILKNFGFGKVRIFFSFLEGQLSVFKPFATQQGFEKNKILKMLP